MPISDAFQGTGILDNHLSDQGKSWVSLGGSLSTDGSGLTTDNSGTGKYYLDDSAYGIASPPRVDLILNLPVLPVPDEAFDIWLFAFGVGADGDSVNFLSLQIECPPSHAYRATALSIDVNNGQDFTPWIALASPPSKLSIDPQTQKFYIDDVLFATLGNAPTWGADSRIGLEMGFVTGLNAHATSLNAGVVGPAVPSAPTSLVAIGGDGQALLQWTPNSVGDSVLSYNVYVSSGGAYTLLRSIDASQPYVLIKPLGDAITYSFKVSAVNLNGEGSLSSAVSVTPTAPAPPSHDGGVASLYVFAHN